MHPRTFNPTSLSPDARRLLARPRAWYHEVKAAVPGASLATLHSYNLVRWPLRYREERSGRIFDVHPLCDDNTFNLGLDIAHFLTQHPKAPGAGAGFYPNMESLDHERFPDPALGRYSPDFLANLRGGLITREKKGQSQTADRTKVVTLRPGTTVLRFGEPRPNSADGAWWTPPSAFLDIVLGREARIEEARILPEVQRGVVGASDMDFVWRARAYSQVPPSFNQMSRVFARRITRSVKGFLGVGRRISDGGVEYADTNFQLYIPNLWHSSARSFVTEPRAMKAGRVERDIVPVAWRLFNQGTNRQQLALEIADMVFADGN